MRMKILLLALLIFNTFNCFADNYIYEKAKNIQREVSKDLPQKISQNLTIMSIYSENETVTLHAVLNYNKDYLKKSADAAGVSLNSIALKMNTFSNNAVCGFALLNNFIKEGGRIDYRYTFLDGNEYMTVKINKCL